MTIHAAAARREPFAHGAAVFVTLGIVDKRAGGKPAAIHRQFAPMLPGNSLAGIGSVGGIGIAKVGLGRHAGLHAFGI